MSQVRQGFFWTSNFLLYFAELIRKLNHKVAIPLPLMRWQGHDTSEIVSHFRAFLLAEVANHVIPLIIVLGDHIEIEGRHVEVEGFVVQKELRDVGEVLAVHSLIVIAVAVHFEDAQIVHPVDLVARRTLRITALHGLHVERAFLHVTVKLLVGQKEVQTVLADKELERSSKRNLHNLCARSDRTPLEMD